MKGLILHENDLSPVVVRAVVLQLVVCCTVIALTLSYTAAGAKSFSGQETGQTPTKSLMRNYEPSSNCSVCHANIYEQFRESMHARSYKNPLFKAVFFNILLPRAENDEDLSWEARGCIACHSPTTYVQSNGNISGVMNVDQNFPGVECDFCHTINSFKGSKPENANYISLPNRIKLGPFKYENDHHRAYAELQTKSEVCAVCHNRTNRYGLEIISTFSEWRESQYAEKGIECQDCHMSVQGFLTKGEPLYGSGKVAEATLIPPKHRAKIYTHRFPGAHSKSQVRGAIQLDIQVDELTVHPGKEIIVVVDVDNSRSGHKLPTGSAELRLLYLDFVMEVDGKTIPLTANSLNKEKYDISGEGKFDATILGNDIPGGSRVYRAICVDHTGQQTQYSFDAVNIVFDNRLQANEIRKESYTFQVPDTVSDEFYLSAKLNYLRYPSNFAKITGVSKAKPIEIASDRKKVVLNKQP
jgi:hypothetical protein